VPGLLVVDRLLVPDRLNVPDQLVAVDRLVVDRRLVVDQLLGGDGGQSQLGVLGREHVEGERRRARARSSGALAGTGIRTRLLPWLLH
jgi:hypothetical protein